jgi:hypothetical protein
MKLNVSILVAGIFLVVCVGIVLVHPIPERKSAEFRRQEVPSDLLKYGETGKILKSAGTLYPIENKEHNTGDIQNVVDVIERAQTRRKKWLQSPSYQKFKDQGIFCYLETTTEEDNLPLWISSKQDGQWRKESVISITKGRKEHALFLDIEPSEVALDFFLNNTLHSVDFRSVVFLKHGYQPIAIFDPVSYRKFVENVKQGNYKITPGFLSILPRQEPRHHKFTLSFHPKTGLGYSRLHKKQGTSNISLTTAERHPLLDAGSLSNDELLNKSSKGLSILSIDIAEEDLHSADFGIVKNYQGRGREWERLSRVRLVHHGQMAFDTFAGLRLQGGDPGRAKGLLNFRVLFRKEYGLSKISSGELFPGTTGYLKRLAVKQSEWPEWPLNNPIAYEISSEIGALAPKTETVELYLNGASQGLYYLVPPIDDRYINDHIFPEQNHFQYRWRGDIHPADFAFLIDHFWAVLRDLGTLQEATAGRFFDLDNLLRHLFSFAFNGTGDYCQGIVLKEDSPDGKMFWHLWDMDHSFVDVTVDINKQSRDRQRWQAPPSLQYFFQKEKPNEQHYCPRVILFRRIVNEDPVFREKALAEMVSILNHRLTDAYLASTFAKYQEVLEKIAHPHKDTYLAALGDFLFHRKAFLFDEIKTLSTGPPLVLCQVSANRYPIVVDGYQKSESYTGYHFAGKDLMVEAARAEDHQTVFVNGIPLAGKRTAVMVDKDQKCQIQLEIR